MTSPLHRLRHAVSEADRHRLTDECRIDVHGWDWEALTLGDLRLHLELAEAVDQYIAASRNAVVDPRDFVARHQLMEAYRVLCIARRKVVKEADDA